MKLAYVFGLVGTPNVLQKATHLAAIELLRRTGAAHDVVSLQTQEAPPALKNALHQLNATALRVEPVHGRCTAKHHKAFRFAFSFTFARLWEQTQYDKLMYFDADLAILSNPDKVFEPWAVANTSELRAPIGCAPHATASKYNTGVWGMTPSREYFSKLHHWLVHAEKGCGIGFQSWIGTFGRNNSFTRLPLSWNMKADKGITNCKRSRKITNVNVIHWSGNRKPMGLTTNDPIEAKALHTYQTHVRRWERWFEAAGD
tara:strand:+ start:1792 stop:2565 length:774 start_codon:yes stop_codon:yes gene_type:complete